MCVTVFGYSEVSTFGYFETLKLYNAMDMHHVIIKYVIVIVLSLHIVLYLCDCT